MTAKIGETVLPLIGAVIVVGGAVFGAIKLLEHRGTEKPSEPPHPAAPVTSVTAPRLAPPQTPDIPAAPGTIYRCEKQGKVIYSDTPCAGAASWVVDVRPTSGFQPPRSAVSAPSTAPSLPAPPPTTATVAVPAANPTKKSRCAAIEKQIEAIDAEARRPSTIPRLDFLRQQRKALVDERGALNCHLVNQ